MILDCMLARLHLRSLLILVAVLLSLALVADFFETARYVTGGKGSTSEAVWFYLTRIPPYLHLLLPVALTVSVFVLFALLGNSLELRALAAGGVGPLRMLRPVCLVALATVVLTVAVGEFLVPPALDAMERLMVERFGRIDSSWRFFNPQRWFHGEGNRIFYVFNRSPDGSTLRGVGLFEMDEDFHLRRRSDLASVTWVGDHWVGSGFRQREFEGGVLQGLASADRMILDWPEGPDRFRDLRGRPKQKPLADLLAAIDEMRRRGLQASEHQLELHNRFAYPVLGFFLVLLAFPFLAVPHRRSTLAAALTEALGLVFASYVLVALSTAAVSGGGLMAAAGAWLPVAVVALLALPGWVRVVRHLIGRGSA